MLGLPGYRIAKEYSACTRYVTYRAQDENQERGVLVKVPTALSPSSSDVAGLRHEHAILTSCAHQGIIKTLGLEPCARGVALILEDWQGPSLRELLDVRGSDDLLPISTCLGIASAVVRAFDSMHRIPVIHAGICPENILLEEAGGQVKLIGFERASKLSSIPHLSTRLDDMPSRARYAAPEQAGYLYRGIDWRTDYYSLGVVLYELLTGTRPIGVEGSRWFWETMLSARPALPSALRPEVPSMLSAVVAKLMEVEADDRYQSAGALLADLQTCASALDSGESDADEGNRQGLVRSGRDLARDVGRQDRRSRLIMPQKLYGRQSALKSLIESFRRVINNRSELVLLVGDAGVGKTWLVREMAATVMHRHGSLLVGHFESRKRETPYWAIVQVIRGLLERRLAEPKRGDIEARLQAVLASNGWCLLDLFPELASIAGERKPAGHLDASEMPNRFRRAFVELVHVLVDSSHPAVFYLGNIQWMDTASLSLIDAVVNDPLIRGLLLVGAYREQEVDASHPLVKSVAALRECGVAVTHIVVPPLSRDELDRFVLDSLLCAAQQRDPSRRAPTERLGSMLYEHSDGNPLLLVQSMRSIHRDELLRHDAGDGHWHWDLSSIQGALAPLSGVGDLISDTILQLPRASQHAIQRAACLGALFSLRTLAIACRQSNAATNAQLWHALRAGLIAPLSDSYGMPIVGSDSARGAGQFSGGAAGSAVGGVPGGISGGIPGGIPGGINDVHYRFIHERMQQAAYALIPPEDKRDFHLQVGRLLLRELSAAERDVHLFLVLNQMNLGRELIEDLEEKVTLIELNLQAARKSREMAGNEIALRYITIGVELAGRGGWQRHYQLMIDLHLEAIAAERARGAYERASEVAELARRQVQTATEEVEICIHQIEILAAKNQMTAAVEIALHALELLEIPLCVSAPAGLRAESLADFAGTRGADGEGKYALADRVLASASRVLYVLGTDIAEPLIYTRFEICRAGAGIRALAQTAADYAVMLCMNARQIEKGAALGQAALQLVEARDLADIRSSTWYVYYANVSPWVAPLAESIMPLRDAIRMGLESGQSRYAGHAALAYCSHLLFLGEHLESIENQCLRCLTLVERSALPYAGMALDYIHRLLTDLISHDDEVPAHGRRIRPEFIEESLTELTPEPMSFGAHSIAMFSSYLFGNVKDAVESGKAAVGYSKGVLGIFLCAEHNLYFSLSLLAACREDDVSEEQREAYLRQVEENQERMRGWSEVAPFNFQHKFDLVEAERARVMGRPWDAVAHYDQAIRGAEEQSIIHAQALASELAGETYLAVGRERVAQTYLTDAYFAYIRWGCVAKVRDLERRYPIRDWLETHAYVPRPREATNDELTAHEREDRSLQAAGDGAAVSDAGEFAGDSVGGFAGDFANDADYTNDTDDVYRPLAQSTAADVQALPVAELLSAVGAISSETKESEVLRACVEWVCFGSGASRAAVALVSDEDLYIEAVFEPGEPMAPNGPNHADGDLSDTPPEPEPLSLLEHLPCTTNGDLSAAYCAYPVVSEVVDGGVTVVVERAAEDPRTEEYAASAGNGELALMCAPLTLMQDDAILGALYIEGAALHRDSRVWLEAIANQTAITLSTARAIQVEVDVEREKTKNVGAGLEREVWELARLNVDKDKFFSVISHDLRNPLNVLVNLAEFLVDEFDDLEPEDLQEDLHKIFLTAERCSTLLENLLKWSKLQSGRMILKPVESKLWTLVDEPLALLQNNAERKEIELVNDVDKGLQILADPFMIETVIRNLVSNALKFTPGGGSVSVLARHGADIYGGRSQPASSSASSADDAAVAMGGPSAAADAIAADAATSTAIPEGRFVVVSIRDTGVGISEEVVAKLFDDNVYHTTKGTNNEGGSGLGLKLCQEMVQQNGGRIWVESVLGQGTTFSFTVPAVTEEAAQATEKTLDMDGASEAMVPMGPASIRS